MYICLGEKPSSLTVELICIFLHKISLITTPAFLYQFQLMALFKNRALPPLVMGLQVQAFLLGRQDAVTPFFVAPGSGRQHGGSPEMAVGDLRASGGYG